MCCAAKTYLCSRSFLQLRSFASMHESNRWKRVTLARNKTTSALIFLKFCLCLEISIPTAPSVSFHHTATYQTIELCLQRARFSSQLILFSLMMDLRCLFNTVGFIPYYLSGFLHIFSGCHSLQLVWPRLWKIWDPKLIRKDVIFHPD